MLNKLESGIEELRQHFNTLENVRKKTIRDKGYSNKNE